MSFLSQYCTLVRLFNCDMKKKDNSSLMAILNKISFKKSITKMELCPTKPIWVISQHALKAKNDGLVNEGAQPLGKQTPLTTLHHQRVMLLSV